MLQKFLFQINAFIFSINLNSNNILQYYCKCDQVNAALDSIRGFFQKHLILQTQTFDQ